MRALKASRPHGEVPRLQDCDTLEKMPHIGRRLAPSLRLIGIRRPSDLLGRDGFALYLTLCAMTRLRHDPSVLDAFLASCDYIRGESIKPAFHYENLRINRYGAALNNMLMDDKSSSDHVF